jgi:uncharacterized RDD family membrane protein YckC
MSEPSETPQPLGFPPPPWGAPSEPTSPFFPQGTGYQPTAAVGVAPGMYFEPSSQLLLPQGTQLASAGRRIGAWFLSIPLAIVTLGIGYAIWGLVLWGRGQTPALQVLGMRVWRPATGKNASFGYMALREIVGRFVEGILSIITLVVSFVLMLTSKDRKSLHDLIGGTVVLYDPNKILQH